MAKVTLTIDQKKVTVAADATILDAARGRGINIPTLCYHEGLIPRGACRLCTVEIKDREQSRLVSSCLYPAQDGLIVETESAPVVRLRKILLELMLASAPGTKAIQDYARRYEVTRSRFETEPNLCLRCGRCVRYCSEIKGKNALGFVGRGTELRVIFFPDIASEECPQCGECFSVCPTGALATNYALARLPQFTRDGIYL